MDKQQFDLDASAQVTTTSDPDVEPGPERAANPRRRALILGVIALVLAAGGTAIAASVDHQAWVSDVAAYDAEVDAAREAAIASQEDADAAHAAALATLTQAITDGESMLTASDGQVSDNTVREDLRAALDEAVALSDPAPTYTYSTSTVAGIIRHSPFRDGSRPEVGVDMVTGTTPTPSDLTAATADVDAAAAAVTTAQAQWAADQLASAISTAETTLSASDGHVLDNTQRDALTAALTAAYPIRDATTGATPVPDVLAQRDNLAAATQAVLDAQTAWQTEQDRLAAEAAASTSTTRASTGTTTTSKGSTSATSGRGSTSGTSGASGSGGATGSGSGSSSGNAGGSGDSSAGGSGSSGGSSSGGGSSWGPADVQATLPGVPAGYHCKSSPSTQISGDSGTDFAAWAASVGNPAKFVASGDSTWVTVKAYYCYPD